MANRRKQISIGPINTLAQQADPTYGIGDEKQQRPKWVDPPLEEKGSPA